MTAIHDESIPLQKLTGGDRNEGAPRVGVTRGVFEHAEGIEAHLRTGPPVLEVGGWDLEIGRKKRKEKLEYMHRNPVTRKLVQHPKDWPWSSWSFYAVGEEGLVPIDPVE